jgi:hypothetical protein
MTSVHILQIIARLDVGILERYFWTAKLRNLYRSVPRLAQFEQFLGRRLAPRLSQAARELIPRTRLPLGEGSRDPIALHLLVDTAFEQERRGGRTAHLVKIVSLHGTPWR